MRLAWLPLLLALAACRQAPAEPEYAVFHYELSVDGVKRDSNFGEKPLRAELGSGQVLPGIDEALRQLKPGEERVFLLPPEKAHGPRDPRKIETMPVADFGDMAAQLVPGARIFGSRQGKAEKAVVEKVENGRVTLDFNPPDAGKTLTVRLLLVSRGR